MALALAWLGGGNKAAKQYSLRKCLKPNIKLFTKCQLSIAFNQLSNFKVYICCSFNASFVISRLAFKYANGFFRV